MRSTKLIQVEVNQKDPTSVKHLLAGIIFSKVLLVWDEENEGFIVSNLQMGSLRNRQWQGVIRCHKYSEV